jgi:hypothetical protein
MRLTVWWGMGEEGLSAVHFPDGLPTLTPPPSPCMQVDARSWPPQVVKEGPHGAAASSPVARWLVPDIPAVALRIPAARGIQEEEPEEEPEPLEVVAGFATQLAAPQYPDGPR